MSPQPISSRGARLAALILSHPIVDAYAGYVPPLLALLQVRCELSALQAAWLLSLGSLSGGLCQPVVAWLADRLDSRVLGAAGLFISAVALSSIGLARDFPTLAAIFVIGSFGNGAYHPIAAASAGQLSGARRSAGVTAFFVAGMVGSMAGPIISTRIVATGQDGFDLLRWTMVPGLVAAVVLWIAIRRVPHATRPGLDRSHDAGDPRERWGAVAVMFAGNAMRYSVHMALLYLFVRLSESVAAAAAEAGAGAVEIARSGALHCGELNAFLMLGMGAGGLGAGLLIRPGREKLPMVLVPILVAPAIALFPVAGRFGGLSLAVLAGLGHAAVIPVTIAVAQRLLPHRTSLASSLMMGGAWAIAAAAPPAAEWCAQALGLATSFALASLLLAASGAVGLLLSGRSLALHYNAPRPAAPSPDVIQPSDR